MKRSSKRRPSKKRAKAKKRPPQRRKRARTNKRPPPRSTRRSKKGPAFIRRRWPGVTAKRPTGSGTYYEALHLAWSRRGSLWYIMGFSKSLDGAKKIIENFQRPGDSMIRKITNGKPVKAWRHYSIRTTKFSV